MTASSIFISYRRSDGAGFAGRIFDRLQKEFGAANVYRDVDTLEDGKPFPDAIAEQLARCRVVLVVIGPTWCNAHNAVGNRRLDDPGDWVRMEVADALTRDVCVIPVTVGGARLPDASDLPENMRALTQRQARELRDGDTWGGDMDLLEARIAKELRVFRPVALLRSPVSWVALALLGAATIVLYLHLSKDPVPRLLGETIDVPAPKARTPRTVTPPDPNVKPETPRTTAPPAIEPPQLPPPNPAQASGADWAGSWNSPEITDPDNKDQKFTLVINFELIGSNLVGTVRDGAARFPVMDAKVTGNSISFYTQSSVTLGNELKPYKQFYSGVRSGDIIGFRSWDDLGGTPFAFDARRSGPARK